MFGYNLTFQTGEVELVHFKIDIRIDLFRKAVIIMLVMVMMVIVLETTDDEVEGSANELLP